MRVHRSEVRIIGFTFILAVIIIGGTYFWTNRGSTNNKSQVPVANLSEQPLPVQQVSSPVTSNFQAEKQKSIEVVNTKIVAIGDSFTYGNPFDPGKSWSKWLSEKLGVVVINKGKIGQTSKDILARFDKEVVVEKPGCVIIFVGNGDAVRGVRIEEYQQAVKTMVEKARVNNIIPILVLPVPYTGLEQRIKTMRDWITSYTREEKITSIDFAAVLYNSQGKFIKGMSGDGKYPSLEGYRLMGEYAAQTITGLN